jgi:hypothetical protein
VVDHLARQQALDEGHRLAQPIDAPRRWVVVEPELAIVRGVPACPEAELEAAS